MEAKNLLKLYNLPEKVIFCKKCTISNQRPRITFDKNGICSACNFAEFKKNKINWEKREEELLNLLDRFRKKYGSYDVLVPCSGGNSSYVAHKLKYKYGMNPLCVTWSLLIAQILESDNFIKSGFNHILGIPDPVVTRKQLN